MNWFSDSHTLYFENARLADSQGNSVSGTVRLARGKIAALNEPPQRGDAQFNLQGALVLPALINAHDHLELNNFPRWKHRDCYANAREWAMEANARLNSDAEILRARAAPLVDRLFLSGLKNLLCGATTVAHHNPYHAPLRKRNFPVRVVSRYGWSHSLYLSPDFATAYRKTPRNAPYMIHLAEGTDAAAHSELEQIENAGALRDNTVLIHGVGLIETQRARAIEQGATLAWCPSSNFFLLNETARVREFSDAHLLAIGSDSRLTGERDLLEELRVARSTKQISPEALFRAVTADAATIFRLPDIGTLKRGNSADLMILPNTFPSAADALGNISRADLCAVIRHGQVQIAAAEFAPLIPDAARVKLDGRDKWISRALARRIAMNVVQEAGLLV